VLRRLPLLLLCPASPALLLVVCCTETWQHYGVCLVTARPANSPKPHQHRRWIKGYLQDRHSRAVQEGLLVLLQAPAGLQRQQRLQQQQEPGLAAVRRCVGARGLPQVLLCRYCRL
jgi:hypothetical protein